MEKEKKSTTVAVVNNTPIVVIENGEKRVAIRPLCQAMGINPDSQVKNLKNDPILGHSVTTLRDVTGADRKRYEMVTIPFKFVFGWLFRIDSRNVKPEAREIVQKYQLECYNALYAHFTEMDEYLRWRNRLAEEKFKEMERVRLEFRTTKAILEALKEEFAKVRQTTFEEFRANKSQLMFDFANEEGE